MILTIIVIIVLMILFEPIAFFVVLAIDLCVRLIIQLIPFALIAAAAVVGLLLIK